MIYKFGAGLMLGAGCLLVTGYLLGQPPTSPPVPPSPSPSDTVKPAEPKGVEPVPKPAEMVPTPAEPGDPTQPSPGLREILGMGKPLNGAAARLPLISIKGRIIVKDKPPAILVDVGGQLQLIAKGSLLAGPNNTTLRVTDLTRSTVTIQVMPQNETIILH